MDYEQIRLAAAEFMMNRGWKRVIGKSKAKGFEQSLFDHTMVELDMLISLLPLLRSSFAPPITSEEEQILLGSVVAHDVGKERPEWQDYVRGRHKFLSDVDRELTDSALPEVAAALGFKHTPESISAVLLHMKHERTQGNVLHRAIFGQHDNSRWKMLADIVDAVDNIASANGLFAGLRTLERSCLANHLRMTHHLARLRGVSTTLLHRAAIDAFVDAGWTPLLYYANGSIHVCSSAAQIETPSIDSIAVKMAEQVGSVLPQQMTKLVVGNPLQSIIPKKDLFDYPELPSYLRVAARKVTRGSFLKKSVEDRTKVVETYLRLKGLDEAASSETIARQSQRISAAHPEMCIFKFFKAAVDDSLVGKVCTDEAQQLYRSRMQQDERTARSVTPLEIARFEYDGVFGMGAFDSLSSTSTLMAARDMAHTIDWYWALDGSPFGLTAPKVEIAEDSRREDALIATLSRIAEAIYNSIPEEGRPTRATPSQIAKSFLHDLIHPGDLANAKEIAEQEFASYQDSKANIRLEKGARLCPICNANSDGGTKAKADFLDNPESHTNRAPSHGSAGTIVICDACKFERFLQQILLDEKPGQLLVIFPRMNVGHGAGELLRNKAIAIQEVAASIMSDTSGDPDLHFSFSLTNNIARATTNKDIFRLSPRELTHLFAYRSSVDTMKNHRRALDASLKEAYEVEELTVDVLNENWETAYASVEDAISGLLRNEVTDDLARSIKAKAFRLTQQLRIVCQTPNLILVPLTNPIGMKDDSEVNAAIRELYVELMLGMSLDCCVAMLHSAEILAVEAGAGIARVPPVAALRQLVGSDWIGIDDAPRWFDAISAAALLAPATGFPERSDLYSILRSPTVGHILRRIEMKSDGGMAQPQQIPLLEKLMEVLK